ncbi:rhodanese-like domain-containing protein [Paraclostridium bifermentans]|uniref:rhodanese-like domain-containing protein n=1 Tax=Paraclostridium bifermentans TaxID=1490 RepID=UPI00046A0D23
MKRSIKLLALMCTLVVSMTMMVGCKDEDVKNNKTSSIETKPISTSELKSKLNEKNWVVVDTRVNDSYNGWILNGEKRGGHIPEATDFAYNWIEVESKDKEKTLDEALKNKGIDKDKNIVLYDANGEDAKKVYKYLSDKGYKNLYIYDINEWANDETLPLEKYKNYEMIVPAKAIKNILDGKKTETFENTNNIKIVEVSWGDGKDSYDKGHIPTSVHINTDTIEPPPEWMLATDKELTKFANDYGFTKNDTIIVTGKEPMAAYRVAVVLRYMGVKDVRVLNGGDDAWVRAGYELEKTKNDKKSGKDFGATIPANPDLIDTIQEVKEKMKSDKFTLVDNRMWNEYIGKISGYSYWDKKGRIPGAVYGHAGTEGSTSLNYYRNIDKTMRNEDEINALWKEDGIDTNNQLDFMCGSGWRAAEVLTYANVMGYDKTALYSDGWIGWSKDSKNPVESGEPQK